MPDVTVDNLCRRHIFYKSVLSFILPNTAQFWTYNPKFRCLHWKLKHQLKTNGTVSRTLLRKKLWEKFPPDSLLQIGELTQGPCPSIHWPSTHRSLNLPLWPQTFFFFAFYFLRGFWLMALKGRMHILERKRLSFNSCCPSSMYHLVSHSHPW